MHRFLKSVRFYVLILVILQHAAALPKEVSSIELEECDSLREHESQSLWNYGPVPITQPNTTTTNPKLWTLDTQNATLRRQFQLLESQWLVCVQILERGFKQLVVCELSADGSASANRIYLITEPFGKLLLIGFEPDLDKRIKHIGGVLKIHHNTEILRETKWV